MSQIKNLDPQLIWNIFDEITKIPRPSKKETKILAFLEQFAKNHLLDYQIDKAGNIVIRKDATEGKETSPHVILQSHMDMVCEKNSNINFDFETDSINTYIDGEWVKAKGTTLGADCGIGMAAAMAILVSNNLSHPAIEALFTVDEETGLTGAFNLGNGMINGKYLINLDSEDEGEIFIGCAGGIDTIATYTYKSENIPPNYIGYMISVKGLCGGHSGDDIEKGRANSNKVINRFLWWAEKKFELRLSYFDGGNLRNAIPREAYAIFALPAKHETFMKDYFEEFSTTIIEEFQYTEKKIEFSLEKHNVENIIDLTSQHSLINSIQSLSNGVLAMSHAMHGLVETSSNLASVKFNGSKIAVTTSQRSSLESAKFDAMATIDSSFILGGAEVTHSDGYPGWTPDPNSKLLKISEDSYKKLFGIAPKIRAIHAGLECGLFLKKYPDLEMISFGPTLRGVHSPDESLNIPTVGKFWALLVECLNTM